MLEKTSSGRTDTAPQIRIVAVAAGLVEHLTEHPDQGLFRLLMLLP